MNKEPFKLKTLYTGVESVQTRSLFTMQMW